MCLLLAGFCSYIIRYGSWVENGSYHPQSKQLVYYRRYRWGLKEAGFNSCRLGLRGANSTAWLRSLLAVHILGACWCSCWHTMGLLSGWVSRIRCEVWRGWSSELSQSYSRAEVKGTCLGFPESAVRDLDLEAWDSRTRLGPLVSAVMWPACCRLPGSDLSASSNNYCYSLWLS